MSDIDHEDLYLQAEAQAGYFTAQQAVGVGMDRSTLSHHARPGGRYERIRPGLYRMRRFPSSPFEHVMVAWLPLRNAGAVVSHESALELHELSDLIPDAVHLTVPRAERGLRRRDGVRLHTTSAPPSKAEIQNIAGLPVTNPERSIVDALEAGAQPEQIELAVRQATRRVLTTPNRLRAAAATRSERVRRFIERCLKEMKA
jgi:predicted transcriptional regulator of viral defense system